MNESMLKTLLILIFFYVLCMFVKRPCLLDYLWGVDGVVTWSAIVHDADLIHEKNQRIATTNIV